MYKTIFDSLRARYDSGEARALAFLVLEDAFDVSRTDVYADKVRHFSEDEHVRLQNILQRMVAGEPVQYVLGSARFCGLDFRVTPATLIPRPETEELVDWAVSKAKEMGRHALRLLDGGTGSGCIAIALSRQLPSAVVTAWDLSETALEVARQNARLHQANVVFEHRDLLADLPPSRSLDLIVSNPPYICHREQADMEEHVLAHEPATALFVPDADPLLFYRALCRIGCHSLCAGGYILMEVNRAYAEETACLFRTAGFERVEVRCDQFGQPRMVGAMLQ